MLACMLSQVKGLMGGRSNRSNLESCTASIIAIMTHVLVPASPQHLSSAVCFIHAYSLAAVCHRHSKHTASCSMLAALQEYAQKVPLASQTRLVHAVCLQQPSRLCFWFDCQVQLPATAQPDSVRGQHGASHTYNQGVGLPAACLSVCQDGAVVTV